MEENKEKVRALDLIMRHYHQDPSAYSEVTLERIAIIKVKIEDMTGKDMRILILVWRLLFFQLVRLLEIHY